MKLQFFFAFLTLSLCGHSQIKYGSNNGKFLTIKGTKVYYEEYGKGSPLLLLHGGFGNIGVFQKIIPKLAKNYRVIIPDAPGLGRSDFADSILSYQLLAAYNSEFIDKLKLDSVYVIGLSDGGISTLILAKNRSDKIKKIVVSGANYKLNGFTTEGLKEARNCADTIWVESELKDWVVQYQTLSSKNWKKYVSQVGQLWFKEEYFPKSELEAIKIPTLVIYGDNDMFTLDHGLEIHQAIRGSQLCILPNCTHEDAFWNKSELIDQIVTEFFKGK